MRMDNYKEKWLDILNLGCLKDIPPRAPKPVVDAMAKVAPSPVFVRRTMQEWKECKIDTEEMQRRLKDKFGENTYKKMKDASAKEWESMGY